MRVTLTIYAPDGTAVQVTQAGQVDHYVEPGRFHNVELETGQSVSIEAVEPTASTEAE